ncbi:MAG TPA: hypothetical protein VL362_00950, partial [Patescibacteria group bacterium]|nr:hypothetical protein [Patescibacteria group bacterium]
ISQLPRDLTASEAFVEFVKQYDWPSQLNADGMKPATEYESDEAFWQAVWHRDAPDYLNNFVHWYLTEPKDEYSLQDTYALKPALHRAYVVAPEFMHALHEAMREVYEVDKPIGHVDDVLIDNPDTVHAAHMAYKLFGRLVTKHDTAILSDMHLSHIRLSHEVKPIDDLHNYFFM